MYIIFEEYPIGIESVGKKKRFGYPTLHKGNRVWSARVEVVDDENGILHTTYGVEDGKMQTSSVDVKINKSGRTIREQLLLELNQKYMLKIRKDGMTFSKDSKKETASTRPFPMLAKEYDPSKVKLTFPVFVQPKLDGVRCLIDLVDISPRSQELRFSSRGRNDFGHLKEVFEHDATLILETLPSGSVLDGELTIMSSSKTEDFQRVVAAARKMKGGISDDAIHSMTFNLFTFYTNNVPIPFVDRNLALEEIFKKFGKILTKIKLVPTYIANSHEDIMKCHSAFLEKGHEGTMIYIGNGEYKPGPTRSSVLYKFKDFYETEGKILDVKDGKGKNKGAAIFVVDIGNGITSDIVPAFTLEERKEIFENKKDYIGKLLTFTYQGYTKDGDVRFAVGRAIRDYE